MGLMRLTHARPEVTPEASVLDTAQVMARTEIGAIAVRQGRKLAGIFTERDLLKRVVAQGRDPSTTPIKEVMTTNVATIPESTSVAEAAAIMRARRMRHLVIVDEDGDYLGILAQRHLLYELMSQLAVKVDDLEGYLMADGPGG